MENGAAEPNGLDAAVDRISEMMGMAEEPPPAAEPAQDAAPAVEAMQAAPAEPTPLEVPQSWGKDMHEWWPKTPRQVQEFYNKREQEMLDGLKQYKQGADTWAQYDKVLKPYYPILERMRIQPEHAIDALMRAHVSLTQGSIEDRKAAYQQLGRNLQLLEESAQAGQTGQPVDPKFQALEHQLRTVQQFLAARDQAEQNARYQAVFKEVEAFAIDKAHPYFSEVSDHITALLHGAKAAGKELSLQDAYDQAVWANPITRAKEIARVQTEHEAKLKENARLDSLPKKRAAGVNVKASDSDRAPTEPIGTLEETIRQEHKRIRERVH